jgi:hypothetical protein
VLDEVSRRVEELQSLRDLVRSQPQTKQTAADLAAIQRALRLAEAELKADIDNRARSGGGKPTT